MCATVIRVSWSSATSIQVLRIWEGHSVLFRDFADPRFLEEVTGEPRPGS